MIKKNYVFKLKCNKISVKIKTTLKLLKNVLIF